MIRRLLSTLRAGPDPVTGCFTSLSAPVFKSVTAVWRFTRSPRLGEYNVWSDCIDEYPTNTRNPFKKEYMQRLNIVSQQRKAFFLPHTDAPVPESRSLRGSRFADQGNLPFHCLLLACNLFVKEIEQFCGKNGRKRFKSGDDQQGGSRPGQIFTDVVGSPYYVAPEVLCKRYGPEADVWTARVILYVLLSGVPPFWAETQQGIFDAVLKGDIDFESEPWPSISESAKDLLRKMLTSSPADRATAHQVLCHPWICEDGVASECSSILSRLKQFSAMNKLKKMALKIIAESLSEEEIAGLREMFKAMDIDNSDAITFDELKAGLKRHGSKLT